MSPDRKKQLHDIYNEIEYILKNNSKNIVTERPAPVIVEEKHQVPSTSTTTVVPPLSLPKSESTSNVSPRGISILHFNISNSLSIGTTTTNVEKPPTPKTPTTPTTTESTSTKSTTPTSSTTPNSDFNFFEVTFPQPTVTPTATTTKADPSTSFSNFFGHENPFITPTNSTNVTPATSTSSLDSPSVPPANTTTVEPPKPAPAPATAAPPREMYKALYDYTAVESNEITFKAGDVIRLVKKYKDTEWSKGELKGKVGFFPMNYCELVKN